MSVSRRSFLQAAGCALGWTAMPAAVRASVASSATAAAQENSTRLDAGWEYFGGPLGGPWEAWHSQELASFSKVQMPHCFNSWDGCDPDRPYYRGQGWYRTKVAVKNPFAGGRTLLHFEGAGQTATIYVGEQKIGTHKGGYDEFVFDVTDAVGAGGQMALAVECDNSPDMERIPSDLSDFSLYGGMYRHVNLVYVPAISVEQVHVQTKLEKVGGPAEVEIRAKLYSPGAAREDVTVTVLVTDGAGREIYRNSSERKIWDGTAEVGRFSVDKPKLWSPRDPQLYRCEVTVKSAKGEWALEERFGIKKTEWVEHGPFLLNGERLLLRGTHRHEDHAGYAAAMPDELIEREMRMIKAMGANFIRLAHYQQNRLVLRMCDELGILVWEEVPWCRAGVGDEAFRQTAREKLTRMIDQHYNHPAILLWGLGNEDDWPGEYPEVNKEAIRGLMTELRDLAHELDSTRMTSFRRCDFARDIPDVYSPSIWAGWYRGAYTEYRKSLETERDRVKHLFHAEWGADSHARRHSENPDKVLAKIATGKGTDERGLAFLNEGGEARVSKDGDWSETYACNLFDWYLKEQETLPWLTGSAQWVFKDFTTPLRVENPVPRVNQKGVVERDLTPKEGYYVFQSYWSEEPMARIYSHTWPVRWGDAGEEKMVKVYSNCGEAELFVNGVSAGKRRRDSQDYPAAGLRWMVKFAEGQNRLRVKAKHASGKEVVDEIAFEYQIRKWSKPARLMLVEKGRSGDVVRLGATLLDEQGVVCLDAKTRVRYSAAGEGTLVENLGTSTGSRVVELFNGRGEISVKVAKGGAEVAVVADGVTGASCEVKG